MPGLDNRTEMKHHVESGGYRESKSTTLRCTLQQSSKVHIQVIVTGTRTLRKWIKHCWPMPHRQMIVPHLVICSMKSHVSINIRISNAVITFVHRRNHCELSSVLAAN